MAARIHESTSSDSNTVVIGSLWVCQARLPRYAVCTNQPSAVRATVRYQRAWLRRTSRVRSLASARPYVPAKHSTVNRLTIPIEAGPCELLSQDLLTA